MTLHEGIALARQQHVLIVDGHQEEGDALAAAFLKRAFKVSQAFTGTEALQRTNDCCFDILVLDPQSPDVDGFALCASLRLRGLHIPILMLSKAAALSDVVRGLACGADDYIAKPHQIESLLARVRAHTRSYQTNSEATLAIGPLNFHPRKRLVMSQGHSRGQRLTAMEASLFALLFRAQERPVDRTHLQRKLWGQDTDLQSHAVDAIIYRLRQKIEPQPKKPVFLLKRSNGYCLIDPYRPKAPRLASRAQQQGECRC